MRHQDRNRFGRDKIEKAKVKDMSDEVALDKRKVCLVLHIDTVRKAQSRFGLPCDKTAAPSLVRAIEEATRDVKLTVTELKAVSAEIQENIKKRAMKRAQKKGLK
jgi:NADPH-dependent ferric siderophore reductase